MGNSSFSTAIEGLSGLRTVSLMSTPGHFHHVSEPHCTELVQEAILGQTPCSLCDVLGSFSSFWERRESCCHASSAKLVGRVPHRCTTQKYQHCTRLRLDAGISVQLTVLMTHRISAFLPPLQLLSESRSDCLRDRAFVTSWSGTSS